MLHLRRRVVAPPQPALLSRTCSPFYRAHPPPRPDQNPTRVLFPQLRLARGSRCLRMRPAASRARHRLDVGPGPGPCGGVLGRRRPARQSRVRQMTPRKRRTCAREDAAGLGWRARAGQWSAGAKAGYGAGEGGKRRGAPEHDTAGVERGSPCGEWGSICGLSKAANGLRYAEPKTGKGEGACRAGLRP